MSSDVCIQWMLRLIADVEVHQKIGQYSVDAFIPAWNVAIEYQGGQHQQQTWRGDLTRYFIFIITVNMLNFNISNVKLYHF